MSKSNLKDFKRIAIIQTAFLGDVTLALYLAQSIKNLHPSCQLFFITTPMASPIASIAKAVDNIITYDKKGLQSGLNGIKRIAAYIQEMNIECIIAPHRSFRTTLITYLSKPKFSIAFNKNACSFLYNKRIKYQKDVHEIYRNENLLKAFDDVVIPNEVSKVDLDFSSEDEIFVENLISKFKNKNDKIIALAPGSVWATKRWLVDYYLELSRMFVNENYKVFLIGSKDDYDLCSRISKSDVVVNLAGKLSLPQTLIFLSFSNLLITNDSAPTHFAGLVSTPTITIFGPTSPTFGFTPIGLKDVVLVNDSLKCHPCHIHGKNKCPIGTFECMKSITPIMVFRESKKFLF